MVNIIVEMAKYVIILLMAAYTFSCFSIFYRKRSGMRNGCCYARTS